MLTFQMTTDLFLFNLQLVEIQIDRVSQQYGNQDMLIHIQRIRKGQLSESLCGFLLAVAPRCQRQWKPGNFVEFKLQQAEN